MATYSFAKNACQDFYSRSPKFTNIFPPHVLEFLENALDEEIRSHIQLGKYFFYKSIAIFGPMELQKFWHSQGSLTGITEIVNRDHHIELISKGVCRSGLAGLNSVCGFYAGIGVLSKLDGRMQTIEWIRILMQPLVSFLNLKSSMERDANLRNVLIQIFQSPLRASLNAAPRPLSTSDSFNSRQSLADTTIQLYSRPSDSPTPQTIPFKSIFVTPPKDASSADDTRPQKRARLDDEKENLSPFFLKHGPPRHGSR
ncbi:hypothetical protein VNI00_011011 [Paramarasmius palmivorus]|uniref:Uncharacterized protein n=1 Tax=Paramarasmius palmivorus TaxID=297713 RepID=A0AAW0CFZ3_9AGAR